MDALGQLGISLPGLATQLISFIILLLILKKVLYGPIVKMLDERSDKIKDSLETAERVQKESAESQAEAKSQLDAARAEGQELIAQALEMADRYREEEMEQVKAEIQEARNRAETTIQREKDAVVEEIRAEFAGIAITAAEKIINQSLDEKSHKKLIDDVLQENSQA